jgi:hypothetical protein
MKGTLRLPWGEMAYDSKTPREVVDDYVLVRGDLVEEYAREQLAVWIERYAHHVGMTQAVSAANVGILPVPRMLDPRIDHDEDWAWFWYCARCGVESRRSSKERVEAWAQNHRCDDQ